MNLLASSCGRKGDSAYYTAADLRAHSFRRETLPLAQRHCATTPLAHAIITTVSNA